MIDHIAQENGSLEGHSMAIAHCNCPQRAEYVKELAKKNLNIEDVSIIDTKGVSSLYACDGGIIVSFEA